jgi:hypothetical protein
MATVYKVLGQSAPTATTDTTIYTVPAATEAIISTITIANRSTSSRSFRITVRPDAAVLANQHYLAYDVVIGANDTTALTLGLTLNAADIVTVYASVADLSFSVFGSEIS